ncbi:MAG: Arm DNA-binding domain-containing protein, partial [Burkholderiaceae bacterium]|nr:Arm DNA-binding domain-containing protein [Burkholderiaceae bacterium]
MARPKKADTPDTTQAIELTAGAIERLTCRTDVKAQAFLRDTKAPGLRVRVTNTGAKSYVFERKLQRQTIRRTIGDVRTWSIEEARTEARRLAVVLDNGQDPREIERQQQADREAAKAAKQAQVLTVGELWPLYLEQGRPKRKDNWKPGYRADLEAMA